MPTSVRIIDALGQPGRRKLKRIRRDEERNAGAWRDGAFVYHPSHATAAPTSRACAPRQSPNHDPIKYAPKHEHTSDSGFNLLPYPMPKGGYGVQFPALARQGAGL